MKSRASIICYWKSTSQNSPERIQELDHNSALVPGKTELALFNFVLFLSYNSFKCLAAILPSKPARAPLRWPEFLAMGTWNLTKQSGSTLHLYCHHTKLSSNWTITISSISGAQNLGNWSVLNQSYLITQTEYGSKLPNITNSIDVINVNCDAITDSLVDGQNSNMITVISTDNLIRSFPFLYEPKFLPFSRVTSSTISKIRFYLTDTIGRPINLNGIDWYFDIFFNQILLINLANRYNEAMKLNLKDDMIPKRVEKLKSTFTAREYVTPSNQSDEKYLERRPRRLPRKRPRKLSQKWVSTLERKPAIK